MCLSKHHSIKTMWEIDVQLQAQTPWYKMEMDCHLHAPVPLPSRTEPLVPTVQEPGWAPNWIGSGTEEKKCLPCCCCEVNPSCPAHSLVTIMTFILTCYNTNMHYLAWYHSNHSTKWWQSTGNGTINKTFMVDI